MHAVITKVSVQEAPEATDFLRERIVPAIKQAPGFVAGYWVRLEGGDEGCSRGGRQRVADAVACLRRTRKRDRSIGWVR